MKFKKLILFALLACAFSTASAQQTCGEPALRLADKLYQTGAFEEVETTLLPCIASGFTDPQKVQAYRLLALSYIANDFPDKAQKAVEDLLKINASFEPSFGDAEEFASLVKTLKIGSSVQLVTSVSKKAEDIRKAPATISVITQDEIIQRGYTDLVEFLADLPGFQISRYYGPQLANMYQRGLRTTNTEKTLLLIDGVEENDLWTNWADISRQYSLSNIKQVEVVYGPASTMYGSNAFAGVINIITKNASDFTTREKPVGVKAMVGYGTYNHRFADVTIGYRKNVVAATLTARVFESGSQDLSSQRFYDYNPDAYDAIDYRTIMSIKTGAQKYITDNSLPLTSALYTVYGPAGNADSIVPSAAGIQQARNLDKGAYSQIVNGQPLRYSKTDQAYLINAKISVGDLTIGAQTWAKSEGGTTQFTDLFVAGGDNGVAWKPTETFFYVKYDKQISDKVTISSFSNYRIHGVDDSRLVTVSNYARKNLTIRDLVAAKTPSWNSAYYYEDSKQFRTELKVLYTPSRKLDIISGIELRNSQLQGNYLVSVNSANAQELGVFTAPAEGGNQFNVNDIGVYTQGTYSFSSALRATLGARVDNNVIRTKGGYGTEINPRVVIDYVKNNWVFKAIYARGIMNVSNWTKFATAGNRVPNPTLGTESIRNFEISASNMFTKYLTADIVIYRSLVKDVVGVRQLPGGLSTNDNIGRFAITGIQSNITYRKKTTSAYINYAYTRGRQTQNENGEVNLVVGDIASHTINAGVYYEPVKYLGINLRSNYISSQPTGSGTSVPANTMQFPAYMIAHATASVKNLLKGTTLQVICNNLFDKTYFNPGVKAADGIENPTGILQRGRNFILRINYDF
ncbi:MAG: TonB-dependent receptor plug domain-containing protein [Bacteroidota bacterium]